MLSNIPSNIRHSTDISAGRAEICGNRGRLRHFKAWGPRSDEKAAVPESASAEDRSWATHAPSVDSRGLREVFHDAGSPGCSPGLPRKTAGVRGPRTGRNTAAVQAYVSGGEPGTGSGSSGT